MFLGDITFFLKPAQNVEMLIVFRKSNLELKQ